ncbi:MAG: SGNH/GDSL hydrolase family protein [Clostridiales bacterium]|nr:SGNH/GDSL hydrolase family protein [Clostridiales bacterium]
MKNLNNYLTPIWEGGQIFRETFTMIEENGKCSAPFLYEPDNIIKVESYDGRIEYHEGKDWYIEKGHLVLTPESRIPKTGWDGIYFSSLAEAEEEKKKLPPNFGLPPIATNDGRYIKLFAIGHPWILYQWQVTVTYTTKEKWEGYKPVPSLNLLPKLKEKLQAKEKVKIVLYGDSISYGFDCTGIYELEPKQPKWADMIAESLSNRFNTTVELINASRSGENSDWALENAKELVIKEKPDLVILGFGMNDRCKGEEYKEKTDRLKGRIQKELPNTEFILIATSLPNTLLNTEPINFYAYQDQYAKALEPLCGQGCILANIQDVQRVIMKRKRYIDLAGNNINHPNDFFARIHGQVIDTLLK